MLWIKRNLFWAVFGLSALVLLAVGAWYLYNTIQKNSEVEEKVNAARAELERITGQNPPPSETNIVTANAEVRYLSDFTNSSHKYFSAVPLSPLADLAFTKLLVNTVNELRRQSRGTNRLASREFAFSFEAQMNRAQFQPGSVPFLAEQLADVRLICSNLFEANVSRLIAVRRPRTPDDAPQSPYCHALPREADPDLGLVKNRYEVTFLTFSQELGRAMDLIARSERFLCVKAVSMDNDTRGAGMDPGVPKFGFDPYAQPPGPDMPPPPAFVAATPQAQPMRRPLPGQPGAATRGGRPGGRNQPTGPGVAPAPRPLFNPAMVGRGVGRPATNALMTLLDERQFKVTLLIESVRPGK